MGDPQPMKLPAEPKHGAVRQAATRGQLCALTIAAFEMSPDPRLAIVKERVDPGFRVGPAAPSRRRDGDDKTEIRIDRDPEMAGPWRVAERVGERREAQRVLPSRSVATAFSIRRWRVSSDFAPTTGSTQNRCRL